MKKNLFNYIIIIVLFLIVMIMFTSARAYSFLDQYMVYVFLILDLAMLFLNNKGNIRKSYMLLFLVINVGLMLLSLVISFGGIGSFLCIINFMILIYLSRQDILEGINTRFLYILILLFYFLSAYISFCVWGNYLYGYNVINPNTIAVVLLYTTIMISGLIEKSNLKHKNLSIILLSAISVYFVINCHCRNAMIALLVFLAIVLIPKLKKFFANHISLFLWIVVIAGIIIPIAYSQKLFGEINFLSFVSEKSIYSGRETIWKYMIAALNEKKYGYLIGLGSHNITELGVIINYHTWFLGIIYMYGLPVFFFYFNYLIKSIKKIKTDIIKIGFISIFITGIFETSAIWINLQFLIFVLMLLDKNDKENKYEKTDSVYTNV